MGSVSIERKRVSVAACLLLAAGLLPAPADGTEPPVPAAFEFKLQDINPESTTFGELVSLSDLYRERGVVINFMASWCQPCRIELPVLQEISDAGEADVACVAADEYGGPENLLTVIGRAGLTVPVLFAPDDVAREIAEHYTYEIIPSTYLIDREGRIRDMHQGLQPKSKLLARIEEHLEAAAPR